MKIRRVAAKLLAAAMAAGLLAGCGSSGSGSAETAEAPAAEAAAQAGNSWVAPGGMDDKEVLPMVEALQNGTLDRERVRRNVYDMYRVIGKYL